MSWDTNIYYSPEKYGLTVVGEADAAGDYEFDKFVIWKDANGRHFWAEDAGCSCPSPFDGIGLDTARQGSLRDALNDLKAWASDGWRDRNGAVRYLMGHLEAQL